MCILLVWFVIIKIGEFVLELRAQIDGIVLNCTVNHNCIVAKVYEIQLITQVVAEMGI